ncbi:Rne/Rng family ribonuclease [Nesterenkonia sp. HG001]|uniref:Rne/Rng family ribonuclease n=1 Tax=Nesterenkonia sp. HG001 TaxID=2983207 RepID=UPI002AC7B2F1|nr:Rne/Rng family ribonuclease [Nesterenkonia sp. HG001]MDZ5078492.1 Rne/Rng family ribonuclease [Nesterenkonia sp. HG001]
MSHTDTPNDTASTQDTAGADIFNPFSPPAEDIGTDQESAEDTEQRAQPAAQDQVEEATEPSEADTTAAEAEQSAPADPVAVLFQAPDLTAVEQVRRSRPTSKRDDQQDDAPARSRRDGGSRDSSSRNDDSRDDESGDDSPRQGRRTVQSRQGGSTEDDRGDSAEETQYDEAGEAREDAGDHAGDDSEDGESSGGQRRSRRKRRRGGRGRSRQQSDSEDGSSADSGEDAGKQRGREDSDQGEEARDEDGQVVRRRRRRRRGSVDMEVSGGDGDDPEHTVTRVRAPREAAEPAAPTKVTGLKGSTRLEAKRQRRRASRETGRRRQVITEAEFLARRESVDRQMIVRQKGDRIQIGVLEDGVLAEHYVSNTQQDSLIGNVYLGKVQNVLPSMEAAFVDIGRGRNAVLYAGEVDWDSANLDGAPRKIENALRSGDSVLVQVTKDPVGHKGARLTSQVSLPGRYLVFVPGGSMTGISRKLPDTERSRLKKILKEHMPDKAGVIVRTAAEGASEEELTNDINRLRALWETIQTQKGDRKVLPPELLYSEPDLTIKVVRDVFNEDFSSMEIQGEETWDNVEAYVTYVAPHLLDRLRRWEPEEQRAEDIFSHHRIDEQLAKALDRKVNLPSGGSLVFDRTEAMTVVDVNTGKFTGSGGNLEETVTRNNLEAAEELVRQLRLRDIGGIIVVDFIDMVLESNRDLVLRRLVECLGRDRTKHQVAEVTSLGLIQMTRKRMGTGLLEVFSEPCEHCAGRGVLTHGEPVGHTPSYTSQGEVRSGKGSKKRRSKKGGKGPSGGEQHSEPSAEEREKQEKARQALAQVAAATTGQTDDGSGESSHGSGSSSAKDDSTRGATEEEPSSGRRRRGRKPRRATGGGRVDVDEASGAQDSSGAGSGDGSGTRPGNRTSGEVETPVLTIGGEPVPVPRGEAGGAAQTTKATEDDAEARPVSLDSLDEALASRSGGNAAAEQEGSTGSSAGRPKGRRRRRAAGSAQGAGGEVREVSAEVSGPSRTFSSTAAGASKAPEPSAAAEEPVMLGVGVSAEKLNQGAAGPREHDAEAVGGSGKRVNDDGDVATSE